MLGHTVIYLSQHRRSKRESRANTRMHHPYALLMPPQPLQTRADKSRTNTRTHCHVPLVDIEEARGRAGPIPGHIHPVLFSCRRHKNTRQGGSQANTWTHHQYPGRHRQGGEPGQHLDASPLCPARRKAQGKVGARPTPGHTTITLAEKQKWELGQHPDTPLSRPRQARVGAGPTPRHTTLYT